MDDDERDWRLREKRYWGERHTACLTYDAEHRRVLHGEIAALSAQARKQAHRSCDTAIDPFADEPAMEVHEVDILVAKLLRRAVAVQQDYIPDQTGADTSLD